MQNEIQNARDLLPQVELPEEVARCGLEYVQRMGIDSLRAEITLFEAARAYTAADGRAVVSIEDLQQVAPMALRLRRSPFITDYFNRQYNEEQEIASLSAVPLSRNKLFFGLFSFNCITPMR